MHVASPVHDNWLPTNTIMDCRVQYTPPTLLRAMHACSQPHDNWLPGDPSNDSCLGEERESDRLKRASLRRCHSAMMEKTVRACVCVCVCIF